MIIDICPFFKAGDPPPSGYAEWIEWAAVQHRAGLRQARCKQCEKWLFPQEFTAHQCGGSHEANTGEANGHE